MIFWSSEVRKYANFIRLAICVFTIWLGQRKAEVSERSDRHALAPLIVINKIYTLK